MTSIYDFGVGGFDLVFVAPDLSNGQAITIRSNIAVHPQDAENKLTTLAYVVIGRNSDQYHFSVLDRVQSRVAKYVAPHITGLGTVRVIFHNEFCTIYVDSLWVYTFSFEAVYYPEEPVVEMASTGGNITITNVRLKELNDWREAIFIDMETTSQNAIGSVVLQRPVDIRQNYLGRMIFEYDPVRSSKVAEHIVSQSVENQESSQAASDAVVYFTDTAVVIDPEAAEHIGFVTRMYRLPDLDNGAIRAARIMQKRARQSRKRHSLEMRYNPIYEVGDIAAVEYEASGTGYEEDADIIIEEMQIRLASGKATMSIAGRENLP